MSTDTPYDDLVMDHIRNARNYRAPDDADRCAHGSNPLCGDEIDVYLRLDGDRIAEAAFQCTCCGISMASASMMTELVTGKSRDEAEVLVREFVALAMAENAQVEPRMPEQQAILETVTRFSTRRRCAALPWQTLANALDGSSDFTADT